MSDPQYVMPVSGNESNRKTRRPWGWRQVAGWLLVAAVCVVWGWPATAEPRIIVIGDSLVAGYGLAPAAGLVPQLQAWLDTAGAEVTLVNAGVSGDTTAMGLARLEWTLGTEVDAAIVALGANDVLRGLSPAAARTNLDAMLAELDVRGIPVLLAGMRASTNLGSEYVAAFDSIYPDLATKYDLLLYPFLLAGVALEPELNQADGIHPNARGVQVIVMGLGPLVQELVDRL